MTNFALLVYLFIYKISTINWLYKTANEIEIEKVKYSLIPKTIKVGRYNDSDTNLEGVNEFSLENFAHKLSVFDCLLETVQFQ